MNNDLEKLLNQVGVPIGKSFLRLPNLMSFQTQEFRIRFLKITGVVILSIFLIWILSGIKTSALKIEKSEDIKTGNKIVDQVSKLIVIPDEMPAIATITKVDLLKDNKFFFGAGNGDQVLIFKNADKAILFSQDANKILNIGKINETEVDFKLDE